MKTWIDESWVHNVVAFAFSFLAIGGTVVAVAEHSLFSLAVAFVCFVMAVYFIN